MAIQMRRGAYKNFDPLKMLPAEWAIVMSGDPVVSDGKSAWICFTAGVVKRMATYDDMVQQFGDMTDEVIKRLEEQIGAALILVNDATQYANNAGNSAYKQAQNAESAANYARNVAEDLENRRDSGEFKGEKGDKGEQGESGVMVPTAGMFSLYVDSETGNLYAEYPDGSKPPAFEYEENSGSLYFVTD